MIRVYRLYQLGLFYTKYDANSDKTLDIVEFTKLFGHKTANPADKCTIVQEDEEDYRNRLTDCSTITSCYNDGFKNDLCNDWESCASI